MSDDRDRIRDRIMVIRSYPCVGSWRRYARMSILASVERALDNDLDIGLTIQEDYPFGERALYPYTIWLDERRRIRGWIWGTNTAPQTREAQLATGQLDMFEGVRDGA